MQAASNIKRAGCNGAQDQIAADVRISIEGEATGFIGIDVRHRHGVLTMGAPKNPDEQRRRFMEAARQIGTDDDPEAFKFRLGQLVKAPATASGHDSDCAVHNGPAYEAGPCDCSLSKSER